MKLADALKIVQTPPAPGAETFQVYLACGILPLHLATLLAAELRLRLPERAVEIQTGHYADLSGNLTRLAESAPDAGAVVIEWSDLDPRLGLRRLGGWGPGVLSDIQATAEEAAQRLRRLLETAARSAALAVCLPTLPLPPISYQPAAALGRNLRALHQTLVDLALGAAEIPRVRVVNAGRLDAISPTAGRLDVKSELSTGFPYRTSHAASVAELLAGLIHPRPSRKALITDLDDTLWRGVLGDDGVEGLSWELDRHSHIHALYQQLLQALAESGVPIGVASKNDPALVAEALKRQDLVLSPDHLFPVEVSWDHKSEAVGRILRIWNLGAEDVVFVDDSPWELAEVRTVYPAMECVHFPAYDDQSAYGVLERLRDLFGKQEILEEDGLRSRSLRSSHRFQQDAERDPAPAHDAFLGQLEAELTVGPVPAGDARALELVNKTNQFNLNGRRLDETKFQAALHGPGVVSLLVSYEDKYGPLGKIAVLLGHADSATLTIDTWVMSCRAFSRQIEYCCLEYLYESLGVSEIRLNYQPTSRNGPLRTFLSQLADGAPSASLTIHRERFMNRKPRLAQKVREASGV